MARIIDVTKNSEKIIVVWENASGSYITYFEPDVTPQEVRTKIVQLEDGYEIPQNIIDMIGSEF